MIKRGIMDALLHMIQLYVIPVLHALAIQSQVLREWNE